MRNERCCILSHSTALQTHDAAKILSSTVDEKRNTDDDKHTASRFTTATHQNEFNTYCLHFLIRWRGCWDLQTSDCSKSQMKEVKMIRV